MKHVCTIAMAALILLAITACTRSPSVAVGTLVADLFAASDAASAESAIDAVLSANPDPALVAQALRVGPMSFPTQESGWQVHEFSCQDGITRIVHLFIPPAYDPAEAQTLLVSLHGAVDHTAYTVEEFVSRYAMWESVAQRDGFIVLMPHGDDQATWWSENGRQYLHDLVKWTKRIAHIDDNKVFLGGFSDGASGSYWMAFHDPTSWAGFIPIYGSVSVPDRGPYACYPSNLRNRPILACNGMGESYVRAESSFITQLWSYGIPVQWTLHQTEHNLAQTMPYERDRSAAFLSQQVRNPFPSNLEWKTAAVETGRCDWLCIDAIALEEADSRWEDINLGWEHEVIHFGAGLQYQGADRGFEVAGIEPGSIAQSMGLKQGDKLLRLDGQTIISNPDIAAVMAQQLPGELLTAQIERAGEQLHLQCVLPEIPVIYTRDRPTAAIKAKASGNTVTVETQRVAAFRIFVSSSQFELSQPIHVIVNGVDAFHAIVQPNLAFMLEQWQRDRDPSLVYEGVIEIAVPPLSNS